MDASVAVIGTGSIGSMTLWQLARAGVDAIGFEQFGIAHDQSAAGGESRIFRTAYLEGAPYVPLLQRSQQLWRELEAESGRALLTLNGGLMIGHPERESMRNVMASIEEFGLSHEVLDAAQMTERFPQHRVDDGEIAVLDHNAGVLRPEFAVAAAAYRARDLGARLVSHTRVTAIEPAGDSVTIRTAERDYTVGQVVVTAGPWTSRFTPGLSDEVRPHRLVMTWYEAREPRLWQPEVCPVFIRDDDRAHVFGIPTLDGGSVKVAPHGTTPAFENPDDLDRNVAVADLAAINAAVADYFPGLIPEPVRVSTYMDGYTGDDHGMVGRAPGHDNVWVLGGFSGHGFKMAPAFGQIAADLVRNGTTDLPVAHLDPSRFTV